jgi:hypothetical protein
MTFRPVISGNSYNSNLNQVNDMVRSLNKEQQVKVFKGANNVNAVVTGRYIDDRYGLLISDASGLRRVLVGQHPIDARPGSWVSKDGVDVIDELSA